MCLASTGYVTDTRYELGIVAFTGQPQVTPSQDVFNFVLPVPHLANIISAISQATTTRERKIVDLMDLQWRHRALDLFHQRQRNFYGVDLGMLSRVPLPSAHPPQACPCSVDLFC